MERVIYDFKSTLELEQYVNKLRINHARKYVADNFDYTPSEVTSFTDRDFIGIYTCLEFKDKKKRKEMLDNIKTI